MRAMGGYFTVQGPRSMDVRNCRVVCASARADLPRTVEFDRADARLPGIAVVPQVNMPAKRRPCLS